MIQRASKLDRPCADRPAVFDRRAALASAGALLGATGCARSVSSVGGADGGSGAHAPAASATNASASPALKKGAVGFMLSHEQFPIATLVEFGMKAEEAGFDLLAASDHLQPWQVNEGHSGQAWITLSAIGQRTRRIGMGTTVTCPTFRYDPAVVAQAFASLGSLYPGRVFLGVGSGEALNEQAATGTWPAWQERSDRLVEATQIIAQLWTGQPLVQKGRFYEVAARLYDPPPVKVPLLMAANGPKAMRRAGEHAEGLITDGKTWREHRARFEEGARAAGKDPSRMPVFVEQFVVVGDRSDAEPAAQLWRFLPKAWNPYFNVPDPAEIERRARDEISIDEVTGSWIVSPDPAAHLKGLTDHFNSGVTAVICHSGQADQKRVIEFYGREELPRMRRG